MKLSKPALRILSLAILTSLLSACGGESTNQAASTIDANQKAINEIVADAPAAVPVPVAPVVEEP